MSIGINSGVFKNSAIADVFQSGAFTKFIGNISYKEDNEMVIKGNDTHTYFFTVPKTSTITYKDLQEYFSQEFLDSVGISEKDDISTSKGIAAIIKKTVLDGMVEDAKKIISIKFEESADFMGKFVDSVENNSHFYYCVRDEEWDLEKANDAISGIVKQMERYQNYVEI